MEAPTPTPSPTPTPTLTRPEPPTAHRPGSPGGAALLRAALLLAAAGAASAVARPHAAARPAESDGLVTLEQAKLTATDASNYDELGTAVAIDGDTLVLGAPRVDDAGDEAGAVYVFTRADNAWTVTAKLTASDTSAGDLFGHAVALSGDTLLVGAYAHAGSGAGAGGAYIFVRDGDGWSQQAKLVPAGLAAGDELGFAVALSGDTAVVTAHKDDDAGFNAGAAYVFVRDGVTWSEQAKLSGVDSAINDDFGYAVASSGDTAVVGAPGHDVPAASSGATYVFTRSGSTWSQQAKVVASDASAGDFAGSAVALDGNTLVIGAPYDDDGANSSGAAYVFARSGETWSEQAKLTAADAFAGDNFGVAVAISADTAAVGAPFSDVIGADSGAAYLFTRTGVTWSQRPKLTESDPDHGEHFGGSIALFDDTVVVGGNYDGERGSNAGAAFVFVLRAADSDDDSDGVLNGEDTCPFVPFADQTDTDADGVGDACDGDDDNDGTPDALDNCALRFNAAQADFDADGVGDVCDNCQFVFNEDQADADGDGLGDACDPLDDLDVDGDGVLNEADNCPFVPNDDQADEDGDGLGDACDGADGLDLDGDGVLNEADNCPFVANDDQADADGDGLGDACDPTDGLDLDGDGVRNEADNCPFAANDDQADGDADGVGDACDEIDDSIDDDDGPTDDGGGCAVASDAPPAAPLALLVLLALHRRRRGTRGSART